ncbi:RND transporter [Maioricimonas sp. JC845]|uniref:RND transporter n=1 Tax=Maioricimonas sp. JC845 TaxID=3232138 RepID=UPI00345A0DA4
MLRKTMSGLWLIAPVALLALAVGCSQSTEVADAQPAAADHDDHDHGHDDHDHDGHDHGDHDHNHNGWWCVEHGVPEEECALCDTSLVADFKEKGDWCDEHQRPDSQCFKCDPKRAEVFVARYVAKFGEQPPAPTE